MSGIRLDRLDLALSQLRAGRPVVVVDDEDRENEGDLIFPAAAATEQLLAFTVRHSSGIICVALPADRLDQLELDQMVTRNRDPKGTAFTVSVDAAVGVTTGISAADRALTLRLLADPGTAPEELTRPGHVFPLRARPGGVLARRGHTEAGVDLMALAGRPTAGALVELVHDEGTMMRAPALRDFADQHGLAMISIEQIAARRRAEEEPGTDGPGTGATAAVPEALAESTPPAAQDLVPAPAPGRELEITEAVDLPTVHGRFRAYGVREHALGPADGVSPATGADHLVLTRGDLRGGEPVLTRVHSECITGDVLGSYRCDCGPQLHEALARIDREGRGVLILLRGHEGRGIGLMQKLRAYALQEAGRDTVEANLDLGLPVDARSYTVAAQILRTLGVPTVRLLSHNPEKAHALRADGIEVTETIDLSVHPTEENLTYLTTKRDRLGHHLLDLPGDPAKASDALGAPPLTTPLIGDTA